MSHLKIIVSGHAVVRASTRQRGIYEKYKRFDGQYINKWLCEVVQEMRVANLLRWGHNEINHIGAVWPILICDDGIILKTLSFKKNSKNRRSKPLSKNQIQKLKDKKRRLREE